MNVWIGSSSTAVTPSDFRMGIDGRLGQATERAAQVLRHGGVAHGEAAHMGLVKNRAVPGTRGVLVAAPGERRVDDAALGHERRAVAFIEGQVGRVSPSV